MNEREKMMIEAGREFTRIIANHGASMFLLIETDFNVFHNWMAFTDEHVKLEFIAQTITRIFEGTSKKEVIKKLPGVIEESLKKIKWKEDKENE